MSCRAGMQERPYLVLVEDECVLSEGIEVRGIEFLSP